MPRYTCDVTNSLTNSSHSLLNPDFVNSYGSPGIILCMCPTNERWHYNVKSSLIGWAHTQNDPWKSHNHIDKIATTDTYTHLWEWNFKCVFWVRSLIWFLTFGIFSIDYWYSLDHILIGLEYIIDIYQKVYLLFIFFWCKPFLVMVPLGIILWNIWVCVSISHGM